MPEFVNGGIAPWNVERKSQEGTFVGMQKGQKCPLYSTISFDRTLANILAIGQDYL